MEITKKHNFHLPKAVSTQQSINPKYDPAPWSDYFDSMEKVNGIVPFYYAGTQGHVFLCLHGAGHSALSFAALAQILKT